jgi:alkylation response protein AidB-like acyl-CoA dehydrogenase
MAQTQAPGADPVELAAELRSLLARNAAQAESDRRLPAENVQALEDANLFKLMVPRRWGGQRPFQRPYALLPSWQKDAARPDGSR